MATHQNDQLRVRIAEGHDGKGSSDEIANRTKTPTAKPLDSLDELVRSSSKPQLDPLNHDAKVTVKEVRATKAKTARAADAGAADAKKAAAKEARAAKAKATRAAADADADAADAKKAAAKEARAAKTALAAADRGEAKTAPKKDILLKTPALTASYSITCPWCDKVYKSKAGGMKHIKACSVK